MAADSFALRHVKRLLPHERDLLNYGSLIDVSHERSSAIWLRAESAAPSSKTTMFTSTRNVYCSTEMNSSDEKEEEEHHHDDAYIDIRHRISSDIHIEQCFSYDGELETVVYRPIGDDECAYLLLNGRLPSTQPYQTIVEGPAGREYCEKYLTGKKWVDTHPTTVVEFVVRQSLIRELFARQHKAEDGVLSMGLGVKAGNGIKEFNDELEAGTSRWRIVSIKRPLINGRQSKKDNVG